MSNHIKSKSNLKIVSKLRICTGSSPIMHCATPEPFGRCAQSTAPNRLEMAATVCDIQPQRILIYEKMCAFSNKPHCPLQHFSWFSMKTSRRSSCVSFWLRSASLPRTFEWNVLRKRTTRIIPSDMFCANSRFWKSFSTAARMACESDIL